MLQARPTRRKLLLPLTFVVAAACALPVDMPIARQFHNWKIGPPRQSMAGQKEGEFLRTCLLSLDMFESFGHGMGVVLVAVLIHQLDAARRRSLLRIMACAFAAGGVADLLKMLVIRIRPNCFDLSQPVWATFQKWLPLLHGNSACRASPPVTRPWPSVWRPPWSGDIRRGDTFSPCWPSWSAASGSFRGCTTLATCCWAPQSAVSWRPCSSTSASCPGGLTVGREGSQPLELRHC